MTLAATRPACAILLAITLGATPALAQEISAKDRWGALRTLLRDRGVTVSVASAARDGDALVLTDVRIWPTEDEDALSIDMPTLRVETRDGRMVLVPALNYTATLRDGRDLRVFTITHDGEILADASESAVSLAMSFSTLNLALTSAMRGDMVLPETFRMGFDDLSFSLDATRDGQADAALSAAGMRYAFDLGPDAADSPIGQRAEFVQEGLSLTLSASELDLLEVIDTVQAPLETLFGGGFELRLDIEVGAGSGSATSQVQGMPMPLSLATETSGGTMSIEVVDGRFDLNGTVGGVSYRVDEGPVTGSATAQGMSLGLGMPLTVQSDTSPAYYRFSLDDVVISSPALTMAGLQDFDGEALDLAVDFSADVRLLSPLGEDTMDADAPPFDVTTVTLAQLTLGVGDSGLTGSGAFTFAVPLAESLEREMPEGTGDFVFELVGGNALLDRLIAAGLVPPDQIFVVQMMMNGLGRSVGEDHLRSELAIRPGGVITVNDAPLPF